MHGPRPESFVSDVENSRGSVHVLLEGIFEVNVIIL